MNRSLLFAACFLWISSAAIAEDSAGDGKRSRNGLKEPLLRISKARLEAKTPEKPAVPAVKIEIKPAAEGEHPLDPAINFAKDGLKRIQANIDDYSCTVVKQERINGELYPQEYMYAEIRNRKVVEGKIVKPFSVYLYFLKPDKIKGREVVFVEGKNDGCLVAHEGGGLLKIAGAVALKTDSAMAMRGNRYPITEIGLENLVSKLVEKAERDKQYGECTVQFKQVKMNSRGCTLLEVVHPVPRPHFEFNIARVYIDDELNLPVRYEAFTWPTKPDGQPELQECYTYLNLKVNIKLEDKNFTKERFRL